MPTERSIAGLAEIKGLAEPRLEGHTLKIAIATQLFRKHYNKLGKHDKLLVNHVANRFGQSGLTNTPSNLIAFLDENFGNEGDDSDDEDYEKVPI